MSGVDIACVVVIILSASVALAALLDIVVSTTIQEGGDE